MRYVRPNSLTWWAGLLAMFTGIASRALPATGSLGELSRFVALLAGSGDASPAGLMFLGLGLIGLRDRVPRRCLSSSPVWAWAASSASSSSPSASPPHPCHVRYNRHGRPSAPRRRSGRPWRRRGGDEDRQMRVAGEIAGSADAVHHAGAGPMGGIEIAVDVEFKRGIDRDHAEASNHLGAVRYLSRAQHEMHHAFTER